jgi:uncharacterized delta-60 repeat protein
LRTTTRRHRGSVSYGLLAFALSLLAFLPAQALARAAAGHLDRSFGGDGKVFTKFPIERRARANSVAIDARGRIVAAGTDSARFFALARYKPNGHLDRSFGGDGRVRTKFGGHTQIANEVAIDTRGRIVAAGTATNYGGDYVFALARYKPNGHLDRSFSGNGKAKTDFGAGYASAYGVAIDSRDRIVAAGTTGDFPDEDFALARYRPNGSLDPSFSGNGRVTTDLGRTDTAGSLAIDSRGRIIAAGSTALLVPASEGGNSESDFALVRYKHDGSVDSSFGTGGEVITDFGGFDGGGPVAIDSRGRIVAAGSTQANLNLRATRFALARYGRDGNLDHSFGTGGKATTDFRLRHDQAASVAIDSRGRIVAAGYTGSHPDYRFALARYGHHGTLDDSFSGNGKVTKPRGSAFSAAIDSRDRIVAAGNHGRRFALARYVG